jgi:hypothetical protein
MINELHQKAIELCDKYLLDADRTIMDQLWW